MNEGNVLGLAADISDVFECPNTWKEGDESLRGGAGVEMP